MAGPPRALGDGRLVLLGVGDTSPAPGRDEEDLPFFLVVVGADGAVQVERRVDVARESVTLLTATPREAILARGRDEADRVRIVAHDYESGEERPLAERDVGGGLLLDVASDRLVFVSPGPFAAEPSAHGCELDV